MTTTPDHAPFFDRCRDHGLAAWRVAPGEAPRLMSSTSNPDLTAALTAPALLECVTRAVAGRAGAGASAVPSSAQPGAVEIAPGLFLFLASLDHASGEQAAVLLPTAAGVGRAPLAAASGLRTFSREQVAVLESMVGYWARDLSRLAELDSTVGGFAAQLSGAFDTIDFLYSVGRSMRDPSRPEQFLDFVCDRLQVAIDFDWVAAGFTRGAEERGAPPEIVDHLFAGGEIPKPVTQSLRAMQALISKTPSSNAPQVLESVGGLAPGERSQVLLQPLLRDATPFAAILAGGKRGADPCVSSYDIQLVEAAGSFVSAFLENVTLYAEQKKMFLGTVRSLTAAIDAKDRYTRGHSERVAHLAWLLARASGIPGEEAEHIRVAGLVHDVGKIGVPEAVLTKTGKLTDAEFDLIKRHPQIGHNILRDIPQLSDVLPGVLHHHERWDGKGYPTGLAREMIPVQARILAIADTFDAMSSTRSYRPGMPRDRVLAELGASAGSQLDPQLVPVMLSLDFSFYDELVARHAVGATPMEAPEPPRSLAA